jgi:hypothetical protein
MIVPNNHLVAFQLMEAWQRPYRVEIIIEDRDLHESPFAPAT